MLRRLLILTILICAASADAQVVLRTSVSQFTKKYADTTSKGTWKYFSFYYNDEAALDSLRFVGHYVRELGGLSKMKPFIRELYDAETLPPNLGGFAYGRSESLRLVLTEPAPGQIRIHEYDIFKYDSIVPSRIIEYAYDVNTGRLLRDLRNNYLYRDSAGLIASVEWDAGRFTHEKWNFWRDTDGVIIALERMSPRMSRDSLFRQSLYQVLNWVPTVSDHSARRTGDLWSGLNDFPWLPEGEPAAWVRQSWTRFGKPHSSGLVERVFDEQGRMTQEWSKTKVRKIEYDAAGRIMTARFTDNIGMVNESMLWQSVPSNKTPWYDVVLEYGNGTFDSELKHLFTYEYAYRYDDGLWGDRLAPFLLYGTSADTISLTIHDSLPTEGLTACIIDTTETEMVQIPLTGRNTEFIYGNKNRKMGQAIRWKYDGRKIVDQAF